MELIEGAVSPRPQQVIIEPRSGYAINVPVTEQNYPGWWLVETDAWKRIQAMRAELGLRIDDKIDEWEAAVIAAQAEDVKRHG